MANITRLNEYRKDPHLRGTGICLHCKAEWQAIAPVGTTEFECPQCDLMTGVFAGVVYPPEDQQIWTCNCGGDVFWVLKNGFMCLRCGTEQTF